MYGYSGKKLSLVVFHNYNNGTKTFTYHLATGLKNLGLDVRLYKYHHRTESEHITRSYIDSNTLSYRNVDDEFLRKEVKKFPMLITCPRPDQFDLIQQLSFLGARIVIHSNHYGDLDFKDCNPIVIHKSLSKDANGAKFLPHPYQRKFLYDVYKRTPLNSRKYAVAMTRLDKAKNTAMILKAIAYGAPIDLYGELMPFYGQELDNKYRGWRKNWKGKFKVGKGAEIANNYQYMIDMTSRGEESGTQYTFFEAMDAGTTPVIHSNWEGENMVHGYNCIAVDNWQRLTTLPKKSPIRQKTMSEFLTMFDATEVAKDWWRELCR